MAVRQRSAKPLFVGSIPTRASNNLRKIRPFHSRRERTILSQNGEQETKPDEKTGRETGRETGRPEIPQKDGVPRFSALEVFDPEQPFCGHRRTSLAAEEAATFSVLCGNSGPSHLEEITSRISSACSLESADASTRNPISVSVRTSTSAAAG